MSFLAWDLTGIAIPRHILEFQPIAISRIDFVDWTFRDAPARVTVSVPFDLAVLEANCDVRPGTKLPVSSAREYRPRRLQKKKIQGGKA
jgi:hypothetical protein